MLECLNIFGNAGSTSTSNPFNRDDHHNEDDREDQSRPRRHRQGGGGEEKQTSLKLSYKGIGEPLVML